MNCSACGHLNPDRQKFCGECGNRLYPPAPDDRNGAVDPSQQGERKQVTVLFCDIVGSTPLAARLGEDRMHRVINEFLAVAMGEVHRFEGSVNQFLGDGFMALFGAPIAREDHSRLAALAGLAIRDAVGAHTWTELPAGERLRIRIGLNAGVVVFGSIGDGQRAGVTAIGDTANVAARLQGEAAPGQVVCSSPVARAVERYVECRSLGTRMLKGKSEPVEVFEVLAARAARSAGVVRNTRLAHGLAGRDAEWSSVKAAVDGLASGAGGILTIVGDAGMGKSRLLQEACALAQALAVRWVQGVCVSYGKSLSYWPFRPVVRASIGIAEDDGEVVAQRDLENGLRDLLGDAGGDFAPFVALLLGLQLGQEDAERVRSLEGLATGHQIFRTILLVVERLAERQPLVIVLDDWQWADASSQALLAHLLHLADRVPVLFMIASRPDAGDGPMPRLIGAIDSESRLAELHRAVALSPLKDSAARELLARMLDSAPIHAQLEARLLRRAGGNPFYLGELARALVATGAIECDAPGSEWRSSRGNGADMLPDSIEGVILARVDRLQGDAKQLLKVAAVVGRSFPVRVLAAVAAGHVDLETDLERLIAADLLEESRRLPERELAFRHPLVQQAAYDSLLAESRRRLHGAAGTALERAFADRIEAHYPILAYHFARAEDWDRAQEYLFLAGTQAGGIAADAEALEHFENALRAARAAGRAFDPVRRAQLGGRMAEALYRLGRNDAALEHAFAALGVLGFSYPAGRRGAYVAIGRKLLARAVRRAVRPFGAAGRGGRRPADPAYLAASHLFDVIGTIEYFLDPPRFVLGILTMLEEAETRPLSRALVISMSALGLILDSLKAYRIGALWHARAARAAGRLGDDMARGYCNHFLGLHRYSTGRWAEALEVLELGARQLEAAGHLRLWSSCIGATYFVLRSMGDPRWMELAGRQLEVAKAINDDHALAWATNTAGVVQLYRGQHRAAIALFEKASAAYEAIPDYRFLSGALARRGLCHALAGETDAGLALLERSAAVVRAHQIAGMSATAPLLTLAEAYLVLAERTSGGPRSRQILALASSACVRATRHGRGVGDESAAESLRLNGLYAWITGDQAGARRLWSRAAGVAEKIGALYVLARTHHEIGTRLGDARSAEIARELFGRAASAPLTPDP